MENYKENFKRDYSIAIDYYNSGEFVCFFRNMRPAIESLCKLIICDLVGEELTKELLAGEKKLDCDFKKCKAEICAGDHAVVQNSKLAILAKNVIYYNKRVLLENYASNNVVKTRKMQLDDCFLTLQSQFMICSELGSHASDSRLDVENEAKVLSILLPKVKSSLKDFLSSESLDFFEKLPSPKETGEFRPLSQHAIDMHNDLFILDSETNYMAQSPDVCYVVFLPESLSDSYGNAINKELLNEIFKINWTLVLDYDAKTQEGLYEKVLGDIKNNIRIITNGCNEVSGMSGLTNWLFARGRRDLEILDDMQALRKTPQLFKKVFQKLVLVGKTNNYIIIDFGEKYSKLTIKLLDELEDVFGDWETVANRCTIFSFSQDSAHKDKLKEWSEDYGVNVSFLTVSFEEFILHVRERYDSVLLVPKRQLLINKNIDLTAEREQYRAAGIEFFGHSCVNEKPKWDFYSGAEITWEELDLNKDVLRNIYRSVKERVSAIVRSTRNTQVYTLQHRPGSGATTLSRRLAYDIQKDVEAGLYSCSVLTIKSSSNINLTVKFLSLLAEKTENSIILAIVESKNIGKDKFDSLVKRMADAGKRVLFFYVVPYTSKYTQKKENVIFLDSLLRPDELAIFSEKYLSSGLDKKVLEDANIANSKLEVVDFPLMLKDNDTSANLSSYVSEWMAELPDNLRKYCAYVGFVFKYSELGVNQNILKSLWHDTKHWSLLNYQEIPKLLIEDMTEDGKETGVWRPRYNRFSDFLLDSYDSSWKLRISEIAKDFIDYCKALGRLGEEDLDMLYSLFVIRKTADFRDIEDRGNYGYRNKFSLLIEDLNDDERAETLFYTLVDAFPDDAIFRGHFARFLYEKANTLKVLDVNDRLFVDAQSHLDKAFELNPDDADLYHMQGMLLRRLIAALGRYVDEDNDLDKRDREDSLHEFTRKAISAFERSIALNPSSPYGYAAECQLLVDSIKIGKKLLNEESYDFCVTNFEFQDYTDMLGHVLDSFEQICYAFKDSKLSSISGSYTIYENVRRFHRDIIGCNNESIQRYRRKYSESRDKEKKLFYGNMLVKAILYSQKSAKFTKQAYSCLDKKERDEIETILTNQIRQGDLRSYESLFMLKLYGSEDYSLNDAIDLLKSWEIGFRDKTQYGFGYLNACFYLAVCYSIKAIRTGKQNYELVNLASSYFKKSVDFAKNMDKSVVREICYLGVKKDIHSIIDRGHKADGELIEGVVDEIKDNKGILQMSCGLKVTFNANKLNPLKDEGRRLRGLLGFSYSGPGLYEFQIDDDSSSTIYDVIDNSVCTFEDLKQMCPNDDTSEYDTNVKDGIDNSVGLKPIGKIDLSQYSEGKKRQKQLVAGNRFEGIVIKKGSYLNIKCDNFPYPLRIERIEGIVYGDFYEDEKVSFEAQVRPNENDPNKPYWYATNVELIEE